MTMNFRSWKLDFNFELVSPEEQKALDPNFYQGYEADSWHRTTSYVIETTSKIE